VQITRRTDALEEMMVVELSGDVDLSAVGTVRSALHDVLHDGWTTVVVDLAHVGFVDSAGLGVLIGLHRRCRERGGECVLVGVQDQLTRLLTATGLDKLLVTATSVEDVQPVGDQPGVSR